MLKELSYLSQGSGPDKEHGPGLLIVPVFLIQDVLQLLELGILTGLLCWQLMQLLVIICRTENCGVNPV